MKRIGILFLFFVLTLAAGYGQNSLLLTSNGVTSNYIRLQWNQLGSLYGYTLFQWDDALGYWQSTSVKCDDTIRVLNVYPDIAGSNTLKTWMDDPSIGFGKILVTPVTLTNFNNNPNNYLENGSNKYFYDVIMFGSWDANNHIDISTTAAAAVRMFLDAGRGVLFGHDAQCYLFPNFASLQDKTNLDIDISSPNYELYRGSNTVKVINDGFLLKYPHFIPYNVDLTIPYTHTGGQLAKGVVWMNFPIATGSYQAPETIINGGTNNFYLTTWNNAAMIQTGHDAAHGGPPTTTDEKKVLANTLWYLAQFTTDTTADICSAPDVTPPFPPVANWGNICGQINISTCDSGTVYKFYVLAATHSVRPYNDTVISNILTVENKSGLRGYFISEDANPNGVPTVARDASNNITTPLTIIASDNQQVTYTIKNPNYYVHIQAVDSAGNLSAATTLKASDLQSLTTYFDTICANTDYNKYGFNILANKLQTAGNFEFRDTIPSTTEACDTLIVLKLNVLAKNITTFNETICEGETYQKNGFNHSVSGTYTQNLQNRFGCDSTVILTLYVATKDTISIFAEICEGEIYTQNGFNASKSGTYTQNLHNRFGCDSLVELNLTVKQVPDIEIVAITDNFCNDDYLLLQLITNGDAFLWSTGSSENPIIVTKSGIYTATAFLNGCEKKAFYTLEECPCLVYIPNAFTPNSDGLNEVFKPEISCFETLKSYKMHVYDRWGNIIFQSSDYAAGWNGRDNKGGDCAMGVYSCVIQYTDSKDKKFVKNISIRLVR